MKKVVVVLLIVLALLACKKVESPEPARMAVPEYAKQRVYGEIKIVGIDDGNGVVCYREYGTAVISCVKVK